MQKKQQPILTSGTFTICYPPDGDGNGYVDNQGNIQVVVDNAGALPPFTAQILASSGSGAPTVSGAVTLTDTGVGGRFTGTLNVGGFSGTPTWFVSVTSEGSAGDTKNQPFRAVHGGSGSGFSGSCGNSLTVEALAQVFQQGQPVPVAVSAKFGAPGSGGAGGTRVQGATLIHSGAPGFERCWFSQPLEVCSDDDDPALWMLERSDAWTWTLRLSRGGLDLVVYRHTAAVEKDGSLPVGLRIVSNGDGEHADWPQTVTISPAP